MRTNARTLRPILVLMLCGIVLTAYDVADSNPAAAMAVLALGAWAAVSAAVRAWAVASAERRRAMAADRGDLPPRHGAAAAESSISLPAATEAAPAPATTAAKAADIIRSS